VSRSVEPGKCGLVAGDQAGKPLVREGLGEHAPRISQHQGEEARPDAPLAQPDRAGAPVDLPLATRSRLESQGRLYGQPKLLPQGADKRLDPLVAARVPQELRFLEEHSGIEADLRCPTGEKLRKPGEHPRLRRAPLVRRPLLPREDLPDCLGIDGKHPCDHLLGRSAGGKFHDRPVLVPIDHLALRNTVLPESVLHNFLGFHTSSLPQEIRGGIFKCHRGGFLHCR